MILHIVNDPLREKYELIPRMLANKIEADIKYINIEDIDKLPPGSMTWHFNMLNDYQYRWNNKIYQYNMFDGFLNVPKYEIFDHASALYTEFARVKREYGKFMVTRAEGDGGHDFLYCNKDTSLKQLVEKYKPDEMLRVSEYIEDADSISYHIVITESNFFWTPPVQQNIKNKTIFAGAKYPYKPIYLDHVSSTIWRILTRDGYIGTAHVDLLVQGDKIYFGEINPRTAASTPHMCCTLQYECDLNLPYVEYYAMRTGEIPDEVDKMFNKKSNLYWNYNIINKPKPDRLCSPLKLCELFQSPGKYLIDGIKDNVYFSLEVIHDSTNKL